MRRLSPTSAAIISIVIALLTGVGAIADEPDGLGVRDREELLGYARDTWKSVAAMGDGSELPVDGLRHLVERDLEAVVEDIADGHRLVSVERAGGRAAEDHRHG